MLAVLPAAVTAMQDRALRGHPRELYVWLYHRLDVVEYRPVKRLEIEIALGMAAITARRACAVLVETGYVARCRQDRVWAYRLVHSNPTREPRPATADVAQVLTDEHHAIGA